jgi:hypothetical protein
MTQLTIYDQRPAEISVCGCGTCACKVFSCLYSTSGRCERKCAEQGGKGGICHPAVPCVRYVRYTGSIVKECLKAVVEVYQDGYISCSLIEDYGCEKCLNEFEAKGQD